MSGAGPPPRYDDVYWDGVAWLDELAHQGETPGMNDRRDDPQWEERAAKWALLIDDDVFLIGVGSDGEPDPENFTLVCSGGRVDAEAIHSAVVSTLADILERETRVRG